MGANGEHTTIFYAAPTHSRVHRTLMRPQLYRRDSKAHLNMKLKQDRNPSRLSLSEAQSSIPPSSDSTTRSEKKSSSSPPAAQLFPVDLSESQAVNQMWAKQGRSQRGLELISGDLVGLKDKQRSTSDLMLVHQGQDSTSLTSVSVAATSAFVSMSPCTSLTTASTSYASSLPSTLFSSFASSSSTSSASTVTVVCRSTPSCSNVPAGNKCLDTCCDPSSCGPTQSRLSPKLERKRSSQSSSRHLNQRSLSPLTPQPIPVPSAIRTPVVPSASPLHVLLDEARKDGICSAELAVQETSRVKTGVQTYNTGRPRARSLSVPADVDNERRRSTATTGLSIPASAPPSPRIPLRTGTLLDNFISFATKLPISYEVYPDTNASTNTTSPTQESYPLLPLSPPRRSEIYTRKFPPLLPQPRSPFRARSPPRHPTPRFRLVENKEYLRLKAVWNRLQDADAVAVDLFVDYCSDDDDDSDEDDTTFGGIRMRELDCGCESEEECDHSYEEDDDPSSLTRDGTVRSRRSRTRRRILHHHPLPSQSLVDKQGNLHTGCELIVGIAIDGLKDSALGSSSVGRRGGSVKGKEKAKARTRAKSSSASSASKLDLLDGLSLSSLVSSPSLSLSSLSHSVRRTLDTFRGLGEGHARRVGASAQTTRTSTANNSGLTSASSQGPQGDCGTAHQDRVQAHAHGHVKDPHHHSISVSGPEGL